MSAERDIAEERDTTEERYLADPSIIDVLAWSESLKENSGDPDKLDALRKARGLLINSGATLLSLWEGLAYADSPGQQAETGKPEIPQFTAYQIDRLEKLGYLTDYSVTGETTASLRALGVPFSQKSADVVSRPEFAAVASRKSAVAFDPADFFLPGSNNKTLEQQLEIMDEFNQRLQPKVPGVKAIFGEAPTIEELIFAYYKRTRRYLLGLVKGSYVRTLTGVWPDGDLAIVGNVSQAQGIEVRARGPHERFDGLYAPRVIVPAD